MSQTRETKPHVLNARGHGVDCRPGAPVRIMGILNVTPDSFSDGGLYVDQDAALHRVEEMLNEGVSIIDIGGESTRPRGKAYGAGAEAVGAGSEKARILPVIEAVTTRFPEAVLSVDTYKADVARAALEAGAHIVNDITGLRHDADLARVAAEFEAPLIVMHSLGKPGEMPHEHAYTDVVEEVKQALAESVRIARAAGVRDVVVDPGFGFGKTVSENLKLMGSIPSFMKLGCPVMVGISRKSTIGSVLGTAEGPLPVARRLFGTLGATVVAVLGGASIVRTHDVQPTVELLKVVRAIQAEGLDTG